MIPILQNSGAPNLNMYLVGSGCIEVYPIACISLANIIQTTQARVCSFVFLFSTLRPSELDPSTRCIACSTDSPIAVPLAGPNIFHCKTQFRRKVLFAPPLHEKVSSRSAWYRVIDGNHHHPAIVLFSDAEWAWSSFSLVVTSVKTVLAMGRATQLVRLQNRRHSRLLHF